MFMNSHNIQKQKLLSEPLCADALKFARAIYNTYLENDEDLTMSIKIQNILNLLKLQYCKDSIEYIKELLEEINEPLLVRDFKYFGKLYPTRFIIFCKYEIIDDEINIEISEEFLHVEQEYMLDSFLK